MTYNTMMKAAAKRRDVQASAPPPREETLEAFSGLPRPASRCFKILDAVNAAKLDPDDEPLCAWAMRQEYGRFAPWNAVPGYCSGCFV